MSSKLTVTSTLPLANSKFRIPQIGFGVYQSPPPTCVNSCLKAFQVGYREAKIPRSEIFVTSKIFSPGNTVESTYKIIEESVKKLGGEDGYADLFLIHSPNGGKESRRLMWLALEKAKETGIVRDIGVSNYGIGHIEEIKEIGKTWPPVVNQIELHPWCQQREIVNYCEENNIVIEAYCPLVRNQKAHDKTLVEIATKHKKLPNQVLIRYCLEKDWVPLPKSDTPKWILMNASVYDFALDEDDMKTLDGLDQGSKGAIVQAVKNN